MPTAAYDTKRGQLLDYFDRTAVEAWIRLTSDAPVNRIRATVRAGRDAMRNTLLDMLPADLTGKRLLDAGCGTGALAVAVAGRGAQVVAIDISPKLVAMAQARAPQNFAAGSIEFRVGDMHDPALGRFDHVVSMDVLIHYRAADVARVLACLAAMTEKSVVFTFAPRTALLTVMHTAGRLFPRSDRAPAIEPVSHATLLRGIAGEPALAGWKAARTQRIAGGFYISQALELRRT